MWKAEQECIPKISLTKTRPHGTLCTDSICISVHWNMSKTCYKENQPCSLRAMDTNTWNARSLEGYPCILYPVLLKHVVLVGEVCLVLTISFMSYLLRTTSRGLTPVLSICVALMISFLIMSLFLDFLQTNVKFLFSIGSGDSMFFLYLH